MFNGIIRQTGYIQKAVPHGSNLIFTIKTGSTANLKTGDSVAVDGICLTVIEKSSRTFRVEAMPETLKLTSLSKKINNGLRVNLENPLTLKDKINGHLVSGHVDFTAAVEKISRQEQFHVITIKIPRKYTKYFALKGSIAVNGVSLTISAKRNNMISVSIIPFTWTATNLSELKKGSPVNVEIDYLAKCVSSLLSIP